MYLQKEQNTDFHKINALIDKHFLTIKKTVREQESLSFPICLWKQKWGDKKCIFKWEC